MTGARPALSPPKTCGLLLCRWRRQAEPEEKRVGGEEKWGEESAARATSLLVQRHIVRETKPGRAGAHTRTHTRTTGSPLLSPHSPESQLSWPFLGCAEARQFRTAAQSQRLRTKKAGRGTFLLRSLGAPFPAPTPSSSPTPPLWVSATHPAGGRFSTLDSARAPRQSPGWPWPAFSKARSSFLRSSGEEPSKRWPPPVPRASLSPASLPGSRCRGNDLFLKMGRMGDPEGPASPFWLGLWNPLRGCVLAAGPGRLAFHHYWVSPPEPGD